jgi:hypothetical protein
MVRSRDDLTVREAAGSRDRRVEHQTCDIAALRPGSLSSSSERAAFTRPAFVYLSTLERAEGEWTICLGTGWPPLTPAGDDDIRCLDGRDRIPPPWASHDMRWDVLSHYRVVADPLRCSYPSCDCFQIHISIKLVVRNSFVHFP